jgi:hypothetical protein
VKNLVIIALILGVVGYIAYPYVINGDNPFADFLQTHVGLPTKDAEGRDLVPCNRCLTTGQITCQGHRCKEGHVPCPGRCLKLSDGGWQRIEGKDPNQLFMLYRFAGRTQAVSQAHVGEIFEVRLGKFYALGACPTCKKQTTITCKVCGGTGKTVCTECKGQKVVLKEKSAPSPVPRS